MKRLIYLTILLLLLFTLIAQAQEDTAPWPPDPSDIFAEGVEVVDTEIYESPSDTPIDTRPSFDDDSRIIRVYDEQEGNWKEFNYPDNALNLRYIRARNDGTILISASPAGGEFQPPIPDDGWILNTSTGEYVEPEIVCGVVRSLSQEGIWIPYTDQNDRRTTLCNTETGELGGSLPYGTNFADTFLSHDGEWLVYMFYEGEYPTGVYNFFSYQRTSDTNNFLGQIGQGDQTFQSYPPQLLGWIDDFRAVVSHGDGILGEGRSYYVFDVTDANSLEILFTGYAQFYEDPSRLEYWETHAFLERRTGSDYDINVGHVPCSLLVYDAIGGFQEFEFGYDCGSMIRLGNSYFFLRFNDEVNQTSNLTRLDVESGQVNQLLDAEIEAIAGISPDGRYIVLLVDNNGYINRINVEVEHEWCCWHNLQARPVIYDTVTQQIIYEGQVYGSGSFKWIEPDDLLILLDQSTLRFSDGTSEFIDSHALLLRFTETNVVSSRIELDDYYAGDFGFASPNGERILIWRSQSLFLLDFLRETRIPVLNQGLRESYALQIDWQTDSLITVNLRPYARAYHIPDQTRSITYTIRLP